MATQKIRIKLKSYEHTLIDQSAERIVEDCQAHRRPACRARFRSPRRRKS